MPFFGIMASVYPSPILKSLCARFSAAVLISICISGGPAAFAASDQELTGQSKIAIRGTLNEDANPLHDPALQAWISQDWPRLIRISTELTVADSSNAAAWRYLGDGYFGVRAMRQAQAAYRKALELEETAEVWESLGESHLWQGIWYQSKLADEFAAKEFDQALGSMQSAQALDPDNAKFLGTIGAIRYHRKEFQLALAALEPTVKQNPQDARSWHYLGMAHAADGDAASAITAFQSAVQLTYNPFSQLRNWVLLRQSAATIGRDDLVREADENLERIARRIRGLQGDEKVARNELDD